MKDDERSKTLDRIISTISDAISPRQMNPEEALDFLDGVIDRVTRIQHLANKNDIKTEEEP